MLLHGHLDMLILEHRERPCDPSPCRVRQDDVVDIAALGGDEGRQEAVFVFLGARGDFLRVRHVSAEDDFDRALGAHDCDLRGRPGVVHVGADFF